VWRHGHQSCTSIQYCGHSRVQQQVALMKLKFLNAAMALLFTVLLGVGFLYERVLLNDPTYTVKTATRHNEIILRGKTLYVSDLGWFISSGLFYVALGIFCLSGIIFYFQNRKRSGYENRN